MMRKKLIVFLFLFISIGCSKPGVPAQTGIRKVFREIEEIRLKQLQSIQTKENIAPFTTDGCSGYLSKSWEILAEGFPKFKNQYGERPPWEACCTIHDKEYWAGSAANGYLERKRADEELRQCVIDTGIKLAPSLKQRYSKTEEEIKDAFLTTAELMYQAVRFGGQPCTLLPWRWGYGWSNCAFEPTQEIKMNYSNIESDEEVVFFNTSAWLDPQKKHWNIPIHARVFEPEKSVFRKAATKAALKSFYKLKVTPKTKSNFEERFNLLVADSEGDKEIVVHLAGMDYVLPETEDNGHTHRTIEISEDIANSFAVNNRIQFFAVMKPDDRRRFIGEVQLTSPQGLSIISDIDDTVKITNVTQRKALIESTFLNDFKAAAGMPNLFRELANNNATFHFVSSSPWQLYSPLDAFLKKSKYPWSTFDLKYFRFTDETFRNLFRPGIETKPRQIEPILTQYPNRIFILIGDSGEQDPEVYGNIARKYPSQIHRILIRNIDKSSEKDERYQKSFAGLGDSKWRLFGHPDEIDVETLIKE